VQGQGHISVEEAVDEDITKQSQNYSEYASSNGF